jgi:hypothetical protein
VTLLGGTQLWTERRMRSVTDEHIDVSMSLSEYTRVHRSLVGDHVHMVSPASLKCRRVSMMNHIQSHARRKTCSSRRPCIVEPDRLPKSVCYSPRHDEKMFIPYKHLTIAGRGKRKTKYKTKPTAFGCIEAIVDGQNASHRNGSARCGRWT